MAHEVREGRLDLAFVALPGDRWPGIDLRPLAREQIALAVPAAHPLSGRASVALDDLQDETLIDLPTGWGTRMANDRSFAAAGIRREVAYEVNDTASLIDFIRHGLAVGMLPPSFVDGIDGIAIVPIRRHAPQFQVAVATSSTRRLGAAARALLDMTLERSRSGVPG